MKNVLKKSLIAFTALVALGACSKGKGSNTVAGTPVAIGNSVCTTPNACPVLNGNGDYRGENFQITNQVVYQQMLESLGYCQLAGWNSCQRFNLYRMKLTVQFNYGRGSIRVSPSDNYGRFFRSRSGVNATAYSLPGNTGFELSQQLYTIQQYPTPNPTGGLRVVGTYVNNGGYNNTVQATIYFNNTIIAQGQMYGSMYPGSYQNGGYYNRPGYQGAPNVVPLHY